MISVVIIVLFTKLPQQNHSYCGNSMVKDRACVLTSNITVKPQLLW